MTTTTKPAPTGLSPFVLFETDRSLAPTGRFVEVQARNVLHAARIFRIQTYGKVEGLTVRVGDKLWHVKAASQVTA
jgi:hypothetical protein